MDAPANLPHGLLWKRLWPIVAGFLLAGLLVYGESLGNEFVRWDDGLLITENPIIRGPLSLLPRAFLTYDPELYIPLTFLSYKVDFLLGGIDPFMYHFSSLLLHILNAILVTLVLRALLKRDALAVVLGLMFLLHPLQTEAVAWASGRKDLLSTAFCLGSVLTYLTYRRDQSRSAYCWSLALFALGLGSKVMIITLPVLLLLMDEWTHRPRTRAMLKDKLPYLGIAAVFGIIAVFGKTTVLSQSTLLEKILMAAKSTVFYLQLFAWPTDLSVLYPYVGSITLRHPDFFVPALMLLTIIIACALLYRRARGIALGFAFFFIAVSPTFTNFAKGDMDLYVASDRYAYLPLLGLLLLLGAVALCLEHIRLPRLVGLVPAGVLLMVLALLTYRQSLTWKDTETLFTHVTQHYPQSYVAHANLANAYRGQQKDDEAIAALEKSLAIRPHARSYANLGAIYRKQREYAQAGAQYDAALKLDPNSKEAHFGFGILQAERGQLQEAEASYRKAIELDVAYGEAWTNLGSLLLKRGRTDEAADAYAQAIAADPWLAQARYNLGVLEMKRGRNDAAIDAFAAAINLEPTHVASHLNMGVLLFNAGEREQAIAHFKTVLQLDPGNAAALQALQKIGE